jgi:DNA repair exonuclease SbcCD ATPase subunit
MKWGVLLTVISTFGLSTFVKAATQEDAATARAEALRIENEVSTSLARLHGPGTRLSALQNASESLQERLDSAKRKGDPCHEYLFYPQLMDIQTKILRFRAALTYSSALIQRITEALQLGNRLIVDGDFILRIRNDPERFDAAIAKYNEAKASFLSAQSKLNMLRDLITRLEADLVTIDNDLNNAYKWYLKRQIDCYGISTYEEYLEQEINPSISPSMTP